MGKEDKLNDKIQYLQRKLNALMIEKDGQVNQDIIAVSQELDELIDQYYKNNMKK